MNILNGVDGHSEMNSRSSYVPPFGTTLEVVYDMNLELGIYRQSPIFLLLTKNFHLVILCKYGNFSPYFKQPVNFSVQFFPIQQN